MHDMVSEQRVVGFALALVTRPNEANEPRASAT